MLPKRCSLAFFIYIIYAQAIANWFDVSLGYGEIVYHWQ